MPEGDTIFRSARTQRAALVGREVLAVRTSVPQIRGLGPQRLVGQTVAAVEPRGKHLLHWFSPSDLALHSHMMMSGSWHLYAPGERWRKPRGLAKVVLEVPETVAVCFSAPVCELLSRTQVERHPSIARLGPDALDDDTDLAEAGRRLDALGGVAIGEALLDQSVLAGVGNVYKVEVLFIHGVDPWTKVGDVPVEQRAALLATAEELLKANVAHGMPARITTAALDGGGGPRLHIYGKARRPCPRCATPIRVARLGEQARVTYWCPRCQGPGPDPQRR
jgi:endonuclease VIII